MKDYSIIWLVSKPLNLFKLFSRIYYKVYIARDNVNIHITILNTFMAYIHAQKKINQVIQYYSCLLMDDRFSSLRSIEFILEHLM